MNGNENGRKNPSPAHRVDKNIYEKNVAEWRDAVEGRGILQIISRKLLNYKNHAILFFFFLLSSDACSFYAFSVTMDENDEMEEYFSLPVNLKIYSI